jgi:membrane protein
VTLTWLWLTWLWLTWLWLTGLALLLGGEVNAEVERSRELRQGRPAEDGVVAPRRRDSAE